VPTGLYYDQRLLSLRRGSAWTPLSLGSGLKLWTPSNTGVLTDGATQFGNSKKLSRLDEPLLRVGAGKSWGVSIWVYFDNNAGTQGLINKWGASAAASEFALYYGVVAGKFSVHVSDGTTQTQLVATSFFNLTSAAPPTGGWHLVNAWYDNLAHTLNIQIDNGAVDSVSYSGGIRSGTSTTFLGVDQGIAVLLGRGDSAGFWIAASGTDSGIALSDAAVRTGLWNSGAGLTHIDLTAAEQVGLVAWYDLGTPANLGRDASTNGLDLTNTNCVIAQGIAVGSAQNGDPVTSEMDQSGAGNNPAQSTASKKPLFVTNVINSLPVVRPDAIDDKLGVATANGLSGALTAFSVYAVVRTGADVTTYRSLFGAGKTGGSPLSAMDIRVSGTKFVAAQQTGGVASVKTGSTVLAINTAYLIRVDFAAGAAPVLYLNGVAEGAASGTPVAFPAGAWDLAIGGNTYGDAGQYGNCDIGTVMILDHTPSAGEDSNILAYLRSKWGF
jgi:hypothetical protein